MPNGSAPAEHPTMIIPKGTEIRVGAGGQLSIKTPGNLVIQNSGQYSEIESVGGSIRIEENVQVEALHVKAAEACYVLGSLTAWKVEARKLTLDERARAFIMLQESQELELARTARLVGNFSSEKEIFLMMSRYTAQLKNLPLQVGPGEPPPRAESPVAQIPASSARSTPPAVRIPAAPETPGASDTLRAALVLVDRDLRRAGYDAGSRAALGRIHDALRANDLPRLRAGLDDDFSAVIDPSDDARRAKDLIVAALRGAA